MFGYFCVQHGGSPACERKNEQYGWGCPKCAEEAKKEEAKAHWRKEGF
jgi:hypothetical protein